MSWRAGWEMFNDCYEKALVALPEDDIREAFVTDLMRLFLDWDIDPAVFQDLPEGSELRRIYDMVDPPLD